MEIVDRGVGDRMRSVVKSPTLLPSGVRNKMERGRRMILHRSVFFSFLLLTAHAFVSAQEKSFCPDCETKKTQIGCSEWLENQCKELYSPVHNGRMKLNIDGEETIIQPGNSTVSGRHYSYESFMRRLLDKRDALPKDLVKNLEKSNFFSKVRTHLKEKQFTKYKSLKQQQRADRHNDEIIDALYKQGIENTIEARLEKVHPGAHKKYYDQKTSETRFKISNEFYGELGQKLWGKSTSVNKAKQIFEEVRQTLIQMIQENAPAQGKNNLQSRWLKDLKEIKLVLPGESPINPNFGHEECLTTQRNAFYNASKNIFTVCAGDLNSTDLVSTIAHELGHALGQSREKETLLKDAKYGTIQKKMNNFFCTPKVPEECPKELWQSLTKEIPTDSKITLFSDVESYSVSRQELRECILKKDLEPYDTAAIELQATRTARQQIDALATDQTFTKLFAKKMVTKDGSTIENLNYLRACGRGDCECHFRASELFVLAKLCGGKKSEPDATKDAIETASVMHAKVLSEGAKLGGKLSEHFITTGLDMSEDTEESYADILASEVTARIVEKSKDTEARRKKVFASAAWMCTAPHSLESTHPDLVSAEKAFSTEAHPLEKDRRKIIFFSPRLRAALDCKKDFEEKNCPWDLGLK